MTEEGGYCSHMKDNAILCQASFCGI